ncbi:MAG: response regulator [Silicimonas sp.]|nr:response regulator [Silicimonas sp.]
MKTVLVIDDDPEIIEVVSQMVAAHGFKTITATDEASAIEIVNNGQQIDLAIVDFWIGTEPALKLLNAIKLHRASMPVMVMSGGGGGDISLEVAHTVSLVSGATQFIQKPFKRDDLLSKIDQLLTE